MSEQSEIEKALKCGEPEPLNISNDERLMLLEMLACVAGVLRQGKLWFNGPKDPVNEKYADLAESFASKLANMPVELEQ